MTSAASGAVEDLGTVLRKIVLRPVRTLMPVWSWKSAAVSAALRAATFYATNLRAGEFDAVRAALRAATFYATNLRAGEFDAVRAGLVEAVFAVFAAGVLGAVSQRLRLAVPAWKTALVVWLAMPLAMLLAQFGVHTLARTPHLGTGLVASFCFAAIASSFSWYAMRNGVLLGGDAETSLAHDARHLPRIVLGYVLVVPRALLRSVRSRR